MIRRVRGSLIQDIRRRLPQLHKIALEPQITTPRHLVAIIILHEQRQVLDLPEQRTLDGDILDLGRLRELEFLDGSEVSGGAEIEIIAVDEEFERLGCGGGGRGAD